MHPILFQNTKMGGKCSPISIPKESMYGELKDLLSKLCNMMNVFEQNFGNVNFNLNETSIPKFCDILERCDCNISNIINECTYMYADGMYKFKNQGLKKDFYEFLTEFNYPDYDLLQPTTIELLYKLLCGPDADFIIKIMQQYNEVAFHILLIAVVKKSYTVMTFIFQNVNLLDRMQTIGQCPYFGDVVNSADVFLFVYNYFERNDSIVQKAIFAKKIKKYVSINLLEAYAQHCMFRDQWFWTHLFIQACSNGNMQIVKYMTYQYLCQNMTPYIRVGLDAALQNAKDDIVLFISQHIEMYINHHNIQYYLCRQKLYPILRLVFSKQKMLRFLKTPLSSSSIYNLNHYMLVTGQIVYIVELMKLFNINVTEFFDNDKEIIQFAQKLVTYF